MSDLMTVADCIAVAHPGAWIAWKGGKCPVNLRALVDFKCRDGWTCINFTAGNLRWLHAGQHGCPDNAIAECDIVAYRMHIPVQIDC